MAEVFVPGNFFFNPCKKSFVEGKRQKEENNVGFDPLLYDILITKSHRITECP